MQCLAHEPDERPTASEVTEWLESVLNDLQQGMVALQARLRGVLAIKSLSVRHVRAADKPAVMAFSRDVYEGHDYLPFVFDRWLVDPMRTMFCVQDGARASEAVALETLTLSDEGATAMFQALRVAPAMRGRGVAAMLTRYVHSVVPAYVRRLRVTTRWPQNQTSVKLHEKQGYSVVLKMGLLGCRVPASAAIASGDASTARALAALRDLRPRVRRVSAAALTRLMAASDWAQYLVPHRVVIVNWEAFALDAKAGSANLQRLEALGAVFYVECEVAAEREQIRSFSIGAHGMRASGPHRYFSVYCGATKDGFLAHAAHHIVDGSAAGDELAIAGC